MESITHNIWLKAVGEEITLFQVFNTNDHSMVKANIFLKINSFESQSYRDKWRRGESDRMIFHLLAPTVSARPRQSQEAGASSVSLTWVAAVQLLGLSPAAFHRS